MGDTNGLGFELASIAAMEHEQRDRLGRQAMSALRGIATIIGCPANTDPLTDLDGLVMMVRGLAERAAGLRAQLIDVTRTNTRLRAQEQAITDNVDARIADAVAADRAAAGAWVRGVVTTNAERARNFIARSIEHGDHIDDDAPPLPSLRMVMLARDEAWRQVETLTAERDRRIDPVEHARAVWSAFLASVLGCCWTPDDAPVAVITAEVRAMWLRSPNRATLLARVGADVLAEVER